MSLFHRLAVLNPDAEFRPLTSDEAVIAERGESLTVQSQTEETDLNKIMQRYGVGQPLPSNPRVPMSGDFSGVTDFQSALNSVIEAQDAFMEFPADVRARFENNPQKMLEFVADDKNCDEAERLGLFSKEAVERRQAARQKAKDDELAAAVAAARAAEAAKAPLPTR